MLQLGTGTLLCNLLEHTEHELIIIMCLIINRAALRHKRAHGKVHSVGPPPSL